MDTFTVPIKIARQNLAVHLANGRLFTMQNKQTIPVPETVENDLLKWLCMPAGWIGNDEYNYFLVPCTIDQTSITTILKEKSRILVCTTDFKFIIDDLRLIDNFLEWTKNDL